MAVQQFSTMAQGSKGTMIAQAGKGAALTKTSVASVAKAQFIKEAGLGLGMGLGMGVWMVLGLGVAGAAYWYWNNSQQTKLI